MKKNIKRLLTSGDWLELNLWINLFVVSIYLIDTIIIFPITSANIMTLVDKKPYFLVGIKSCYAFLIIISIIGLKNKPNFYWIMLNLTSIGVLSIWIYSFCFYSSTIDKFLLELSSIWLLIIINLKSFIKKYSINRNIKKIIWIIVISIIMAAIINYPFLS